MLLLETSKQMLFARWQRQGGGSEPITGINETCCPRREDQGVSSSCPLRMGDGHAGSGPPWVPKARCGKHSSPSAAQPMTYRERDQVVKCSGEKSAPQGHRAPKW